MKKIALTLALITLLSSLSACAPSGTENPTDTAGASLSTSTAGATDSPTASPTEAQTEGSTLPQIDVYEGTLPSSRGYRTDYILKAGDTGYFDGKTKEELYEMFTPYSGPLSYWFNCLYTSTGVLFDGGDAGQNYYDKQTGGLSKWCPKENCRSQNCPWHHNIHFLYVSKDHIYFWANTSTAGPYYLWRCDHDRQNARQILPRYLSVDSEGYARSGYLDIISVDGDKIYMTKFTSKNVYEFTESYGHYDLSTRKFTTIPEADGYSIVDVNPDGTVWSYKESDDGQEIFCAKSDFSVILSYKEANDYTLRRSKDYRLEAVTDTHLVFSKRQGDSDIYNPDIAIDLETRKVTTLGLANLGELTCVDNYIYYVRALTPEEMVGSPLTNYYLSARGANTGGRLWRMNMDTREEELVLQLSYNDVPLSITGISVDGKVCYIQYRTYKDFRNLYSSSEFYGDRFAVADLASGTVEYVNMVK